MLILPSERPGLRPEYVSVRADHPLARYLVSAPGFGPVGQMNPLGDPAGRGIAWTRSGAATASSFQFGRSGLELSLDDSDAYWTASAFSLASGRRFTCVAWVQPPASGTWSQWRVYYLFRWRNFELNIRDGFSGGTLYSRVYTGADFESAESSTAAPGAVP